MKKGLVFFSLIVCFVLVFSINCFAAKYTDIDSSQYRKAIENLSNKGVIAGYEDGTYKPEKTISRAEISKLLIASLGYELPETVTKSNFDDVPTTHWAIKYITVASDKGIIKGDGNGKFRPDDKVNYSEAVTMVIRMLGYAPEIEGIGTWPQNYIDKANELKIFNNVEKAENNSEANRGSIAQILYNSNESVCTKREYPLIRAVNDFFDMATNKYLASTEQMKQKFISDVAITGTVSIKDETVEQKELIEKVINNSEMKFRVYCDMQNNFMQLLAKWLIKNQEVTNGEIIYKDKYVYINSADFLDKPLRIDLGEEGFDASMQMNTESIKTIDVFEKAAIKYINNTTFNAPTVTTIEVNNVPAIANKYSITFNDKNLLTLQKYFYEYLLLDEDVLTIYVSGDVTIDDAKSSIKNQIDELDKQIKGTKTISQENVTAKIEKLDIYIEKDTNKLAGLDIKVTSNEGKTKTSLDMTSRMILGEYSLIDLECITDNSKVLLNLETRGTTNQANSKILIEYYENSKEIVDVVLNIESSAEINSDFTEETYADYITEIDEERQNKMSEALVAIIFKVSLLASF